MPEYFLFKKEDGHQDVRITAKGYLEIFRDRVADVIVTVDPDNKKAVCSLIIKGEKDPRRFVMDVDELPEATRKSFLFNNHGDCLLRNAVVRRAFETTFPEDVERFRKAVCGPAV